MQGLAWGAGAQIHFLSWLCFPLQGFSRRSFPCGDKGDVPQVQQKQAQTS